jgi:hypothetical protein
MPDREETPGTWLSHETAQTSVMMQVPDAGAFVRALLPIRLVGGQSITYGVWLAIDPRHLGHIFSVWWEPEYVDLRITGWLANPIPPWGMLAAPVEAAVRDSEHTPYCERSSDSQLARVLNDEWSPDILPDLN